jgi:hypothetical protein
MPLRFSWPNASVIRVRKVFFLQPLQPSLRIAEMLQLHVVAIHQRQIQAAHLAVILAVLEVIQRASGLQRSAKSAGQHHRQAEVVVFALERNI